MTEETEDEESAPLSHDLPCVRCGHGAHRRLRRLTHPTHSATYGPVRAVDSPYWTVGSVQGVAVSSMWNARVGW